MSPQPYDTKINFDDLYFKFLRQLISRLYRFLFRQSIKTKNKFGEINYVGFNYIKLLICLEKKRLVLARVCKNKKRWERLTIFLKILGYSGIFEAKIGANVWSAKGSYNTSHYQNVYQTSSDEYWGGRSESVILSTLLVLGGNKSRILSRSASHHRHLIL